MTTSPGWYPDPAPESARGSLRWWDGGRWTEQTRAPQAPAAQLGLAKPVAPQAEVPLGPAGGYRSQVDYQGPVPAPAPSVQLSHTPDGLAIANPWKRLGAQVIDALIMLALVIVLELIFFAVFAGAGALIFGTSRSSEAAGGAATAGVVVGIMLLVVGLLAFQYWYYIHRVRKVGATFGKQWLGLRIRTFHTDGQLTWAQVWGRFGLVSLASSFTAGVLGVVDVLWLLWDKHCQTLHDKTVGTIVVDTSQPRLGQDHPAVQYARSFPAPRGWVADGPNPQTPAGYPR